MVKKLNFTKDAEELYNNPIKSILEMTKESDEAHFLTMNINPEVVETIAKQSPNTEINIIFNENIVNMKKIKEIEKNFSNINFEPVEGNHIKGYIFKSNDDGDVKAIIGSNNLTKSGLMKKNIEFMIYQSTEYDHDINQLFSCSSVIQGFTNEIKDQTGIKILRRKEISKKPVKFLDAKEYGETIENKLEEFSKKGEFCVNIYTPYANVDFILDLLSKYKDQLYGLRLTFDEIDNPEKLRSEFEDVVLNLEQSKGTHGKIMSIFNDNDYSFFAGTSNISRSGLGKGYTKPESNLAFDGNFEAFNEFALFSMDPSLYASNKFENKLKMYEAIYNKSKSRRDLIKYFRKVEDITKKYEKIIDKIIKAEENNDYAQLIRTLKEIYNEDKKEDEINKMHMFSFGVKFHEELEKRAKKII